MTATWALPDHSHTYPPARPPEPEDRVIQRILDAEAQALRRGRSGSGAHLHSQRTIVRSGSVHGSVLSRSASASSLAPPPSHSGVPCYPPRSIDRKNSQTHLRTWRNGTLTGELRVEVVGAFGLLAADINGKSDPYVIVRTGEHKRKTRIIRKTLAPEWHETFRLRGELDTFLDTGVTFEVYDWDPDIGPYKQMDDVLGTVHVKLDPELRLQPPPPPPPPPQTLQEDDESRDPPMPSRASLASAVLGGACTGCAGGEATRNARHSQSLGAACSGATCELFDSTSGRPPADGASRGMLVPQPATKEYLERLLPQGKLVFRIAWVPDPLDAGASFGARLAGRPATAPPSPPRRPPPSTSKPRVRPGTAPPLGQQQMDPSALADAEAKAMLRRNCEEAARAHKRRQAAVRRKNGGRDEVSIPVLLPSKFDCALSHSASHSPLRVPSCAFPYLHYPSELNLPITLPYPSTHDALRFCSVLVAYLDAS